MSEREETLARELLGERAAALRRAMHAQIVHRRGGNAHEIDAAVVVEALVFDGDDRVHQVRRDLGQRRFNPPLLKNRERRVIVLVIQRRGLRHRADVAKLRGSGKTVRDVVREPQRPPNSTSVTTDVKTAAARNASG